MHGGEPRRSNKRAEFLERQGAHSKNHIFRCYSEIQRQIVKANQAHEDSEFWGAQGVEGFKTYLQKKFGSVLAGWRMLDKDGNGHLSHGEFCQACRKMGYHGNLKLLWSQLDVNGSNSVSLQEIDPEVGHYISTFKRALMEKHGDMLTAWKKGVDVNGSGRIDEAECVEAVNRLGLDLDGKKLYGMLINGPKGIGLSLQQFDPDSWTRWVTGDIHGFIGKANMEFLDDAEGVDPDAIEDIKAAKERNKGGLAKFREQMKKQEKADIAAENDNISKMKAGLHSVEGFKDALRRRCGSLYGAWREALDLDGNGRLTFGEFCQGLSRLAMFGEVRGLWKMLDTAGNGWIEFKDLDPETDASLQEFRQKLKDAYGNMLLAWMKGVDLQGNNCVNEKVFVQACQKVGYSGNARKLFRVLQPDRSRKYLTLKDFDTPAYQALSRADFRMISEDGVEKGKEGQKSLLEMTFDERQEAGFFYQIREAWKAADRAEFKRACNYNTKDYVIDTFEEFEGLCKRKFGSMTAAWRQCLDTDFNGKLTFNEFCAALRRLGYAGNFKTLWSRYDQDKKGYILLADLDAVADRQINSFLAMLGDKYGDLDNAWAEGFGKDPHGMIDKQELVDAATAMGWEGDTDKLFKDLQPMQGRLLLSIWDLDPSCSRKRARGQVAHISKPKDAGEVQLHRHKFGSGKQEGKTGMLGKDIPIHQQMRNALRKHFGSTAAAWRSALDPKMSGQVSFGKFCLVMEECAFEGKLKVLWEELVDGRLGQTGATYAVIDPDNAKLLDNFRKQMVSQSGSIMHCWKEVLAVGGGPLDEDDFVSAVQEAGFIVKSPKKLFKLLLGHIGQRSVTEADLRTLLIGVDPKDRAELWGKRRAEQPADESAADKAATEASDAQAAGAEAPASKAPEA